MMKHACVCDLLARRTYMGDIGGRDLGLRMGLNRIER